ncbi:4-hydroxythreonine-4-phosphate dehydrogenase [Nitrosophilus kaiyonis]|uniref:4-hydroxythreonine-4-phosphate dehydrogenase n=1 Tax=Nitrosophilus kaiyonis TaxID=2930200 RepID=UPI002490CF63|nr:4-hydroxythreonine-4-phosphate dehydrogenase [Nitrosophilus kaiyonis]
MQEKPTIAISIGDINGIGIEIALKAHEKIKKFCKPLYFINDNMLKKASKLLNIEIPKDFETEYIPGDFEIKPGKVDKDSGKFSFESFKTATIMTKNGICEALVTLPIHKKAWEKAGIKYKGHTDFLRDFFKKDAIMMLGCEELFVALFTEHIPLKDVPKNIKTKKLKNFLLNFYLSLITRNSSLKIPVLALNPHAGDNGVLGNEEKKIKKAIKKANKNIKRDVFIGPIVPDIAFIPKMREKYKIYVAMYHDQGLIPLKALYFEESINISLNLPIIRTSVDHGTAFDIAYKKDREINLKSYINAVKYAVNMVKE